ncbi:MAG: hypothetical protein ACLQQ4_12845 [Bacteroidia bacterium]
MRQCILKIVLCFVSIICISFTWIGCSTDSKKAEALFGQNGNDNGKDTSAIAKRVNKVHAMFNNLPSALKVMQLFKKSGSRYAVDIPNDPTLVSKYSTKQAQAINLGIYTQDLSFAGLFNQKDDASFFLESANKLAGSLGIPDAFNENIINRIESNMANSDSLLAIILSDFWTTDTYLKKSDRQEVSAYLVSGGWVEGMYIAAQLEAKTNNQDIANEMARQKISLDDLAEMLQTYPASQNMTTLIGQIKKIQDVYSGVQVDSTSKEDGPPLLTPDQLKAISESITALRNQMTKSS